MITHTNCIEVWFSPHCESCGEVDESFPEEPIKKTINDICDAGVPLCQNCSEDLSLMNNCLVKA